MATQWTDWQWSEQYRRYYRQRQDENGEYETLWADPSTPRSSNTGASSLDAAATNPYSHNHTHSYDSNYTAPGSDASPQQTGNYNLSGIRSSPPQEDTAYDARAHYPVSCRESSGTRDLRLGDASGVQEDAAQASSGGNAGVPPERTITTDNAASAAEALDPKFRRLRDPREIRRFFVAGRVFSLLWTEPASQSNRDAAMSDAFSEVRWGQQAYTEIRRFIVIKAFTHHSLCVPIATYRRYGTTRRPDAQHHSIAYSSHKSPQPLQGEHLERYAIPIITENGETLEAASRINFSKIYTIEHNIKINPVGKVSSEYLEWVLQYCKDSTGIETRT